MQKYIQAEIEAEIDAVTGPIQTDTERYKQTDMHIDIDRQI